MLPELLKISTLAYLNYLNTYNVEIIAKDSYTSEMKLQDIGHNWLPLIENNTNMLTNITPIILFIYVFLFMNDKHSEIVNLVSIIVLIRMISTRLTIFPSSDPKCNKCTVWGGCHDKMFSGHTAITVALCLYIYENNKNMAVPCLIAVFTQSFISIATRGHYSVDVFMGGLIALFMFNSKNSIL